MFFTHGPTILQAWLLFYRIYNKHHVPGTHSELRVVEVHPSLSALRFLFLY